VEGRWMGKEWRGFEGREDQNRTSRRRHERCTGSFSPPKYSHRGALAFHPCLGFLLPLVFETLFLILSHPHCTPDTQPQDK